MTEQDEPDRQDRWLALGVRTDIPHPARVYNYLLGGTDNFPPDQEVAEFSVRTMPQIMDSARANRAFHDRAVRLLHDSGIRQFLDVGTGLPTTPNTHEITAENARRGATFIGRSKETITAMFNGRELVEPGVSLISYWRPDGGQPRYDVDRVWGYCGVART
jgi:hypothetical protein